MRHALIILLLILVLPVAAPGSVPPIRLLGIDGPINPVTADYLHRNLGEAAARGEQLVIVEIDTPGGLDSAMRAIVKDILTSAVPVVVHVAPSGARAASAGAVIALAADVCAMAPGTNIGAAHPVTVGGQADKTMQEKMVNDAEAYVEGIARRRGRNPDIAREMVRTSSSLTAEKAVADHIADLIATDRQELLKKLEGRRIERDTGAITLNLAGAELRPHPMGTRQRILSAISNPDVAYVLLMLGMLGLFFELSTPGAILPGVIGGIALILAFFALQTLSFNYAGALLILLALVLFIAEVKIVSHGMLTVGGIVAMIFGSLLLFDSPDPYLRISWSVIIVSTLATAVFFTVAVTKAVKAHRRRPVSGREGLIDAEGRAETAIAPEGKVLLRGEYWDAWSDEPIAAGDKITVIEVDGIKVKVVKVVDGR